MNLQKGKKKTYILGFLFAIIFVLVVLLLFQKSEPEYKILAKIGDKVITQNDFILNYEFGLPHLKIGNTFIDKKKKYLQFMINEYLLSLYGEENGLNNAPSVKKQTIKLKKELLLESIVENDIKPNINITEGEIKEAINKSKVSFKFFHWSEKDLRNALIIKKMFEENGIEETFNKLSSKKSDIHFDISKYTTDYLSWLDIPEETFDAIKDLPANEFSEPVKIGDLYFIFQIQDIRRTSLTTKEYLDKSSTFRKILFSGKLQKEVVRFVDKQITPKNITTKINVFNVFSDAVADWVRSENRSTITFSHWAEKNKNTASVRKFNNYQDSIFITYRRGSFTLGEFQGYFDFDKITAEYKTKNTFKFHLNNILAISIRDYFLTLEAEEKGYDKSPWFKHEYMKWTSKFVFEEQLRNYMSQKTADSISVADNIISDLTLLKTKYRITIDSTMLDTITINETEKSKQSYIQLMKRGIERMAEPIVDGHWISISN